MLETTTMLRKNSWDGFVREDKERIEKEAIKKLIQTINYYMSDSLTVLLGQAELLEGKLKNKGYEKEDTRKFIGTCKEELFKIRTVLSSLREVEGIRYKNHPFGFKVIDLEDKIKQGILMIKEKRF
jgi:signal transduction histidine kinase